MSKYVNSNLEWYLYISVNSTTLKVKPLTYDGVIKVLGGTKEEWDKIEPGDISILLWEKLADIGVNEVEFFEIENKEVI